MVINKVFVGLQRSFKCMLLLESEEAKLVFSQCISFVSWPSCCFPSWHSISLFTARKCLQVFSSRRNQTIILDSTGINRSQFCDNSHLAEIGINTKYKLYKVKRNTQCCCVVSHNSHFAEEALLMFPGWWGRLLSNNAGLISVRGRDRPG